MRVAQRVEFSLTKQRVEKLIVYLGYDDDGTFNGITRGALATQITQRLLRQCQPGESDVHDPDVTRANARDRQGRPRSFFAAHEKQLRRSRHGRSETLRSPQMWDTSPVADFMGRWCDRLLLGDHQRPARCAILEPRVPPLLWGEAVSRVARAHRHLRSDDVLLVQSATHLPFGVVRLQTQGQYSYPCTSMGGAADASSSPASALLLQGTTTVAEAVKLFAPSPRCQQEQRSPSYLQIGVGDAHGPQSLLSAEESTFADRLLLPLCTFTTALWTASPLKAADYVATLTATPQTLTEAQANHRLWRTMQHAMLSTRDTALLRAYFNHEGLDARFSPVQTRYFAETLLRRLHDQELQR